MASIRAMSRMRCSTARCLPTVTSIADISQAILLVLEYVTLR